MRFWLYSHSSALSPSSLQVLFSSHKRDTLAEKVAAACLLQHLHGICILVLLCIGSCACAESTLKSIQAVSRHSVLLQSVAPIWITRPDLGSFFVCFQISKCLSNTGSEWTLLLVLTGLELIFFVAASTMKNGLYFGFVLGTLDNSGVFFYCWGVF